MMFLLIIPFKIAKLVDTINFRTEFFVVYANIIWIEWREIAK